MKPSDIGKLNNHVKGILCIIAAAAGFSLMTFFVRISGDIPTMQKVFFRNAVALVGKQLDTSVFHESLLL